MTMLQGPTKGDCEGNRDRCTHKRCPIFGTLLKASRDGGRRVRGCGDPQALGKRSNAKGKAAGRRARRQLNLSGANTAHEELWRGALRVEVKAGAQVGPIRTKFVQCELQSLEGKASGDHRPFAMVAMPDGFSGDGLVLMRLSVWSEVVAPLMEEA